MKRQFIRLVRAVIAAREWLRIFVITHRRQRPEQLTEADLPRITEALEQFRKNRQNLTK